MHESWPDALQPTTHVGTVGNAVLARESCKVHVSKLHGCYCAMARQVGQLGCTKPFAEVRD